MGVDLSGGLSLNWSAWRYCLNTALHYGWKPEGTRAPKWPDEGSPNKNLSGLGRWILFERLSGGDGVTRATWRRHSIRRSRRWETRGWRRG
jgi:hypothetical protein